MSRVKRIGEPRRGQACVCVYVRWSASGSYRTPHLRHLFFAVVVFRYLSVFAAIFSRRGRRAPSLLVVSFAASPPPIPLGADVCNLVRVFVSSAFLFVVLFCLSLFFLTFRILWTTSPWRQGSGQRLWRSQASCNNALGCGCRLLVSAGRPVLPLCRIDVR